MAQGVAFDPVEEDREKIENKLVTGLEAMPEIARKPCRRHGNLNARKADDNGAGEGQSQLRYHRSAR